jgi:hypothetical protein
VQERVGFEIDSIATDSISLLHFFLLGIINTVEIILYTSRYFTLSESILLEFQQNNLIHMMKYPIPHLLTVVCYYACMGAVVR